MDVVFVLCLNVRSSGLTLDVCEQPDQTADSRAGLSLSCPD